MPTISVHPPRADRVHEIRSNSYPQTINTPSGLALLEIQGSINSTIQQSHGAATPIGKIVFPLYDPQTASPEDTAWQKRVYLYVGHHQRLTGEVKKLGKAIAILQRRPIQTGTEAGVEEMEIAEIVRYKLLFASRPEPVGSAQAE